VPLNQTRRLRDTFHSIRQFSHVKGKPSIQPAVVALRRFISVGARKRRDAPSLAFGLDKDLRVICHSLSRYSIKHYETDSGAWQPNRRRSGPLTYLCHPGVSNKV
jgi:hypothetical protein